MKKHILYANLFAITLLSAVTVTVRSGTEKCTELSVYNNEVSKQLDCLSKLTKKGLNDLRIDPSIYNLINWHMTPDMLQDFKSKKEKITSVIHDIINQVKVEVSLNPVTVERNVAGLQNVSNQIDNMRGVVRSGLNESLLPELDTLQACIANAIDDIQKIAKNAAENANSIEVEKERQELQKLIEVEKANEEYAARCVNISLYQFRYKFGLTAKSVQKKIKASGVYKNWDNRFFGKPSAEEKRDMIVTMTGLCDTAVALGLDTYKEVIDKDIVEKILKS